MRLRGLVLVAALLTGGLAEARPPAWGPWDDAWAPVGAVEAGPRGAAPRGGLFEVLYRWYRTLSRSNAGTCPYYPTCSGYFILSVRAHGPALAALFTWDRLMREYPFMERADHYPLVTPHGTPRLHDPIPDPPGTRRRERRRRRGAGD